MTAESGSNDQGLRELAQRLLTHAHPEGPTSVEVLLRRLPESVAVEIPMPPGSHLLGSVLHSRQGRPTLMEAVFDSEREPHEVVTAYEPELAQRGWNAFEGFGGMHGGFVPGGMGEGRSFRQDNKGPVLMVAASAGKAKPTDLRLRLDWEIIRHLPEMRRHGRPEGAERMPTLGPPSGIFLRGGGGGGGGAPGTLKRASRPICRWPSCSLTSPCSLSGPTGSESGAALTILSGGARGNYQARATGVASSWFSRRDRTSASSTCASRRAIPARVEGTSRV